MEQHFDHEGWLAQSFAPRTPGDRARRSHGLDWHTLALRLAAGHAFQRGCDQAPMMLAGGSFDPYVAERLKDYAPVWDSASASCNLDFLNVNPVPRGVRKTMSGIDSDTAGPHHPGDRGMK